MSFSRKLKIIDYVPLHKKDLQIFNYFKIKLNNLIPYIFVDDLLQNKYLPKLIKFYTEVYFFNNDDECFLSKREYKDSSELLIDNEFITNIIISFDITRNDICDIVKFILNENKFKVDDIGISYQYKCSYVKNNKEYFTKLLN